MGSFLSVRQRYLGTTIWIVGKVAYGNLLRNTPTTDPIVQAWHAFAESALRLLSGFLAGIGAGYITHVALDFGTPRCLPLVC